MTVGLNNTIYKGIMVVFLFCLQYTAWGQARPGLGGTSRMMNNAISAMEQGNYETANRHFREIINSNSPIPPEMPYHFAVTLYHLGQYDNSANFIKKYLELNGYNGEHYEQAKELETKLNAHLQEIQACEYCDNKGYRYTTCTTCEGRKQIEQRCSLCRGQGIIGCSRCAGKGLVTKKNVFNIVEYFECERCSGDGRLSCHKCEGTLIEFDDCRTCQAKGVIPSENICDHQEHKHLSVRTGFRMPFHSH